MDPGSALCRGCARTIGEIAEWAGASERRRREIWSSLPRRYDRLGIAVGRLPWGTGDALDFVENSVRRAGGTWVMGVHGAVGEFSRDPGEALELARATTGLTVRTPRGGMRLELGGPLRVLAETRGQGPARGTLLLCSTDADRLRARDVLTCLGADARALLGRERRATLFDLGLGRTAARFCVRTADPGLLEALRAREGMAPEDYLGEIAPLMVRLAPTRVIVTALGRMEVDTPIPPPGGESPSGPHTHLLPGQLALGLDAPPGLDLPAGLAPGAIFYPGPDPE